MTKRFAARNAVTLAVVAGAFVALGAPVALAAAPPIVQASQNLLANTPVYYPGQVVTVTFSCTDGNDGPGIASCVDTSGVASGSDALDTSSLGPHNWNVTATSLDGEKAYLPFVGSAGYNYVVVPPPPPGPIGVTIDGGAFATNTRNVEVDLVWPNRADGVMLSNNGGFGASGTTKTFGLAAHVSWVLQQTGYDKLPETVYVRFLPATVMEGPSTFTYCGAGGSSAEGGCSPVTYTGDIIYDTQAPTLTSAQLLSGSGASADGVMARTPRSRIWKLKLQARDVRVGICEVSVRGVPVTVLRKCKKRGITSISRLSVASRTRPRYVRVRNSAGTWSRWVRVR